MRSLIIITAALFINSAHAETYNYVCTDRGKSYPLKVDDEQNTLVWKGAVYKIKTQLDCAKFGWHAEKEGASFDFCTATQGYADFEQNGTHIECNLKRSAERAEPSNSLPRSFYGYYVYASEINDGLRCKKNERTPTEDLERTPEIPEDHVGYQMTVTSSEIQYDGIGTHVSCNIEKVYRPENKDKRVTKYVGPWLRPFDPVYALNLRCFDEGTTSRGTVMFRLIPLGSSTLLLETEKSLVANAWAKCRAQ